MAYVGLPLALCVASPRQKLFNSIKVLRADAYKKKLSLVSWFFPPRAPLILLKAILMTTAIERWMQSLKHELPILYWDKMHPKSYI